MAKAASRGDVIRRLRRLGFAEPFPGGKHEFMTRASLKVFIPNPHDSDLSGGLVSSFLKQAGVTEEEWEKTG
ncbi:MAG: type II toxin-antitoxin system HicA family toxin [Chloroflexi bacterium]|nr:type II toxin-antitoxin system HicA family toxin [Chloroflexota bacterium]